MNNSIIFRKILVATDGSENSERAVNYGIKLSIQNQCKLYILYVIDQNIIDSYKMLKKNDYKLKEELITKGEVILSRIRKIAESNEIDLETKITRGTPYQKILDYSEKFNVDLVILGHESTQRPLTSHYLGSTAKRVLEYMKCPILVIN